MPPRSLSAVAEALGQSIVESTPLDGGFSHHTWLVTLTDERVVVRGGGADPAVEASIMATAATRVPVPQVRCVLPEDGTMAVEYLAGTLLADVLADPPGAAELEALGTEVGRVAARIGDIGFDRPGFFTGTGLSVAAQPPWSEQLPDFAAARVAEIPSSRLDTATGARWARLCAAHAAALTDVDDDAGLVHADLNPKNLLVDRDRDRWRVTGVLDWEFGFAGPRCADAANMLRFSADYPPGYAAGFRRGFGTADEYPGRVMDMFALTDLVTRPPGHPIGDRAARVITDWLAHGVPGR